MTGIFQITEIFTEYFPQEIMCTEQILIMTFCLCDILKTLPVFSNHLSAHKNRAIYFFYYQLPCNPSGLCLILYFTGSQILNQNLMNLMSSQPNLQYHYKRYEVSLAKYIFKLFISD